MAKRLQPGNFKIRVVGNCPTHARTDLRARTHRFVIDEPEPRGGADQGPTPLETLLASFLGCTNVIANKIAAEMGIVLEAFSMELVATLDTDGINGIRDTLLPFPEIILTVKAVTAAPPEQMEILKARLAKRCPVSVILRGAGTKIIEDWRVSPP